MAALPAEGNAAALFFWEAHNDVNARLRREDAQQAAGAQRLEGALPQDAPWHMPFPTSQDCEARAEQGAAPASASCRSPSGGYDAAAVLGFLRGAYGFGATAAAGGDESSAEAELQAARQAKAALVSPNLGEKKAVTVQVPEPAAAREYAAPSGAEPQWEAEGGTSAEGGGSGSTVLLLLGAGALLLGLRRCCGGLQPAKQSAH